MKICPVGEELFLADGRTDTTNLIVAFHSFVNAPKSRYFKWRPVNIYVKVVLMSLSSIPIEIPILWPRAVMVGPRPRVLLTPPMVISVWILLRIRIDSDKSCRENQSAHLMVNNFLQKYYSLWDNVKKYGTARQATDDGIKWRVLIACWITKTTNTHSEYAICTYSFSTATMVMLTHLNITL
jgi:hypothetical protein